MRTRWAMVVLGGCMVALASCGDDSTEQRSGPGTEPVEEEGYDETTVPPEEEMPRPTTREGDETPQPFGMIEGAVFAATYVQAGDGVWVFGGLRGVPGAWEPNTTAYRYDLAGEPVEEVTISLADGAYLRGGSSVHRVEPDGSYVVAVSCPLAFPEDEQPTCGNQQPTPVLLEVTAEGIEVVEIEGEWGRPLEGEVPTPVRLGGAVDGRLFLAREIAPGPIDAVPTFVVAGGLYDPESGAVEDVPIDAGVLTKELVCASRDALYSVVPIVTDDLSVESLTLLRQAGPHWEPEVLAQIDGLATVRITGGALDCSDEVIMVSTTGEVSEVLAIDPSDGSVVGLPVPLASQRVPSVAPTADGGFVIVSWIGPEVAPDGRFLDHRERAQYVRVDPEDGPMDLGEVVLGTNNRPQGMELDGVVVDVSEWAKHFGMGTPPLVIER